MNYNQPYGGAVDAPFVNGDPSIGRAGSIPPAESIEYPQREIVNIITNVKKGDGTAFLSPTNTDLIQLAKAIQSGLMVYARDVGTVNSYQVTLWPAPTAYFEGMTINLKVGNTNTGASVINSNALGAKAVVKPDGTILVGGEMLINSLQTLRYDGTSFQLIGGGASGVQRLTANKDIYVNNSIGSDVNDGTANIAGKALATIQKAVDIAFGYAPSQFIVTIHISGHTYSAGGKTPPYPGPTLTIDGAGIASTLINAGSDYGFLVQGPNTMTVTNVKVANTAAAGGPAAFTAASGAFMTTDATASGACGGAVFQSRGGSLVPGTHTFSGSAYTLFWGNFGGNIQIPQSKVYTISAAIATTVGTAFCAGAGSIGVGSPSSATFVNPSNVTGARFLCIAAGGIDSSGNGNTYFPGNAAGSTASSGWYI